VISISSGHAAEYLTGQVASGHENYYTGAVTAGEPPGFWSGRGAAALGLAGVVDAQDMTALFELRLDPRDGRFRQPAEWGSAPRLGGPLRRYITAQEAYERMLAAEPDASGERRERLRLNAEHSARSNLRFLDVTFSAPKSVTVLAVAFERQLVDAERAGDTTAATAWRAHRDAVESAVLAGNAAMLDYLQDLAGYSRIGHHGGAAGRYTDGHDWVVASFLQHDSRDHDPQLHVHNAVLNRVENPDGKWRTLATRAIYAHRAAAGALAERVMEEHLSRSLGVRFATRPDGKAREVLGVQPEVMELFSSRRRAITARTAALVAEFRAHHGCEPNTLELDRLQRRAAMATRRAKSSAGETSAERLDRWDTELRAEVTDGLAGVARDVLGLVDQPPPVEEWSPIGVLQTALAEVQDAKPTWTRCDVFAAIGRALPDDLGGLGPVDIRQLLDGLTEQALSLPQVQQVAGEVDADRPVVPELLLADGRSPYSDPAGLRFALQGQMVTEHVLRRAAVERGAPVVPKGADALDALEGMALTAGQRQALIGILTMGAKIDTLVGPAGTGKSTVVGALARIWSAPSTWGSRRGRAPRVVGLASSEIATNVLRDEGLPALNVTRWLAAQERLDGGSGDPQWQLAAGDLVVVDEAAMLPTADLAAIHQRVAAAGAKLLLTGDHRQLSAVGAGGGMALLDRAGRHELTEVVRFAAEWEGPASLRLRDGDDAALFDYRKHGRLLDAGTPEQARWSAVRAWLADSLSGRQSVVVVRSNEDAARVSGEIRAELVRLGRVTEHGVSLGPDGNTAGIGDLVQARRNAWELQGWNGNPRAPINREVYRVARIRADGGLTVERDGHQLELPPAYVAADLTLGYAGTVHSTQGRTVDTAHVVVDEQTSPEALYVGLTRGRSANHAHVVTHPVDEDEPRGAGRDITRTDPIGVLASILATGATRAMLDEAATRQAQADADRRHSVQTAIERFAAEVEMVYTARTAATLDRLAAAGALTVDERLSFAAETTDTGALARLLRSAELAGHDPDRVLTEAIAERSFDGARSLPQVLYRRIERRLEGALAPTVRSYGDMVPSVLSPLWHTELIRYAEAAEARRQQLGQEAAETAPQWAAETLGAVPEDPLQRLGWEQRAGTVAAWRELSQHQDPADALGSAPRPGKPEHYAVWRAAWAALGRPDAATAEAELSEGQLRIRVRAYEREKAWAPPYVGESLTATALAAEGHRRTAVLTAARADATSNADERAHLRAEAREESALAESLHAQMSQLSAVDEARASWLVHTAVTRETADRANAELAARGVPLGAEAEDAMTAEDWLDAHRSEQAAEDAHRPVTAEYELTGDREDALLSAEHEDIAADVRDSERLDFPEEPGRVPPADECRRAVQRAQLALAEIEQRRTVEQRRLAHEDRERQLNRWAAEDALAAKATAEAADTQAWAG
jgi:conjugative relaxase-like TrwC/TraI family protein